jgi:hypothetical protein
MMVSYRN